MSVRLAILSFTLFAGVAVTADAILFAQCTKTLALAGEVPTPRYLDRVTALFGMGPEAEAPSVLPGFLPPAPTGWTRAPYQRADGERATGRRFTTPNPASRSGPAAFRSGNEVLSSLESPVPTVDRVVETYASGDLRVIVALTHRPGRGDGRRLPLADHLARILSANPADLPLYGTVQGVNLWQKPLLQLDPGPRLPFATCWPSPGMRCRSRF